MRNIEKKSPQKNRGGGGAQNVKDWSVTYIFFLKPSLIIAKHNNWQNIKLQIPNKVGLSSHLIPKAK